jgi:uncharacterized protein YegL
MCLIGENCTFIPLKKIDIDVKVDDLIANVTIEQFYENSQDIAMEVLYKFPIDDNAIVYNFCATIDDVDIHSKVIPKNMAQKEYDNAISVGKFGALLQDEETDIFQIRLGNFKKKAVVKLSYYTELKYETINNHSYAIFYLPTTIYQRYNTLNTNFTNNTTTNSDYHGNFNLQCCENVSSPSHSFEVLNEKIVIQNLDLDRDIIFHIDLPLECCATFQRNNIDSTYTGMITYIPKLFCSEYQNSELIFLIDQSGSMQGQAIRQAKEALNIILHSLPENSYFNIVSFGSTFKTFSSDIFESVKYSQETLLSAKEYIRNMNADFGGTEIVPPLKSILKTKSPGGYKKLIFVLTDGQVANVDEIIETIQNNTNTFSRIFSIGLGAGACHHLVNSIARFGKGSSMYVSLKENLEEKILQQISFALQPEVNADFSWNPVKQIPEKLSPIYNCNLTILFGIFNTEFHPPYLNGKRIQMKCLEDGNALTCLAVKRMIQEMDDSEEIIKLGLKYNIITKYTSFIALGESIEFKLITKDVVTIANQIPFSFLINKMNSLCLTDSITIDKFENCTLVKYIINLQNFDGSFTIDEFLKKEINYSDDLCPTAFVLAYLEMKCTSSISTWMLAAEKSKKWLKANNLEQDFYEAKCRFQ